MEKYYEFLEKFREHFDFDSYSLIDAGYSFEKKFLLRRINKCNLLLRLKKIEDKSQILIKEREFEVLSKLRDFSEKIPMTHTCGYDEDFSLFYSVLDYIEGEDAESTLKNYSEDVQYRIGYEAGIELKKMHMMESPEEYNDWYGLKKRKYELYSQRFRELNLNIDFLNINRVMEYVDKNMFIMKDINPKFQHDDFHPGNIIISDGEYKAAIDFNRYDWGDPIHDFYKVALLSRNVSIPFSVGQINGYTKGSPDEEFWKRYALYNAMIIIPDTVWSYNYAMKTGDMGQIECSKKRLSVMYEDHEQFETDIPAWYHNHNK